MTTPNLEAFALVGIRAEIARLTELAAALERANGHTRSESPAPTPARRRKGMSQAQRQATSKRMKAYWRQRRAAAKG